MGNKGRVRSKRLHLTLFVEAEHQRVIGRIEIQPDDVAHLLDKLRIRRELERVHADAIASRTSARCGRWSPSTAPRRPPCCASSTGWCSAAGASSVRVMMSTRTSSVTLRVTPGPRFVGQPFQALDPEPFAPLADAVARHVQCPGDRAIGLPAAHANTIGRATPDAGPFSGDAPTAPACAARRPSAATVSWGVLPACQAVISGAAKGQAFSETRH